MVENNISRRKVLVKSASAGALTGAVISSDVVKALPNGDEGIVKLTSGFLEFGIGVSAPDDAVLMSSGEFPSFFRGSDHIYLPTESQVLENADGELGATPDGIRSIYESTDLTPVAVPISADSAKRSKKIGQSQFKEPIELESTGQQAVISIGEDRIISNRNERTSFNKNIAIEYKGTRGAHSREVETTIEVKYNPKINIYGHKDLLLIPKKSPGGRHIRETIIPKMKDLNRSGIGNWDKIYNLTKAPAWGISRTNRGEK